MRPVLGLLLGAVAVLVTATPVGAQDECIVKVERHDAPKRPGGEVIPGFLIQGSGFEPDESVQLDVLFGGEVVFSREAKTGSDVGVFLQLMRMKASDPPGEYTVRATGESCTAEATFDWMPDTATEAFDHPTSTSSNALIAMIAGLAAFVYLIWPSRRLTKGSREPI